MLNKEIQDKLNKPLDAKRVKHRVGGGGMQLSYIEGHDCIDAANEIFGYGNWSTQTLDVWQIIEKDIVKGYAAKVGLEVLDCKPIIGIGFNPLQAGRDKENGASPDSHDMAIKGAETDAMKRCFRNYGDQFGNSLYDKTLVDGQPKGDNLQQQPQRQQPTTQATTARETQQPAQTTNRPTQAPAAPTAAPQPAKPVTTPQPIAAGNDEPFKFYSAKIQAAKTIKELKEISYQIKDQVSNKAILAALRIEYDKRDNALVEIANQQVAEFIGAMK